MFIRLKLSSTSCFKYFVVIKWRKTIALEVVDLLAGSCVCTLNKLIVAKTLKISPLTSFFLNSFLILKLSLKAATKLFYKKAAPNTFRICTGKCQCWSLFVIKLQAFRTVARLSYTCTLTILFSLGKIL